MSRDKSSPAFTTLDVRQALGITPSSNVDTTSDNNNKHAEEINANELLTNNQAVVLRDHLATRYSHVPKQPRPYASKNTAIRRYPVFSYDVLLEIRDILGRWLRPPEIRMVFGGDLKVFSQLFKILDGDEDDDDATDDEDERCEYFPSRSARAQNASSCPRTNTGPAKRRSTERKKQDPRFSYVIGRGGTSLRAITRRSGCLHIWIQNHRVLDVFAAGNTREEAQQKVNKAVRDINAAWLRFAHSTRDRQPPLRAVAPPGSHIIQIPIKVLYKAMSQ